MSGGPSKDGIPALTAPTFVSINDARKWLDDDVRGIEVRVEDTARFYPYNILVWHEIVNDTIEGKPLLVTFCPLCGSAIVFERVVDGEPEIFGVSGKLYESNLLMYDHTTESLWSQILGEAVVGSRTGKELTLYPSQVKTFKEFYEANTSGEILSKDTGYTRNYNFYPYGNYDNNDDLYFPVSVKDTRLPSKTIMYIVPIEDGSVAFHLDNLTQQGSATIKAHTKEITATVQDDGVVARDSEGMLLPGYHAMWFSWATHHQEDGVVWTQ